MPFNPEHGGQLHRASQHYGIPVDKWLDLSTGISPWVYPLPPVPPDCWQRLPETHDGLETVAAAYYGSAALLPVAGSQAAIGLLARLRPRSRVGILSPAYRSHYRAWQSAGHEVLELTAAQIASALPTLDVLIVVNPTNPTAQDYAPATLLAWHKVLAARGGWLIVDEAFRDATPEHSLIQPDALQGLIVLRSIGKFFGLAGIRLGFVWAESRVLHAVAALQDDWAVSHPARWAGKLALADRAWQQQQRERLQTASQHLHDWLEKRYGNPVVSTALFAYVLLTEQEALQAYEQLARQGILVRLFRQPWALRFGLPEVSLTSVTF
jgi:cobalamin biosynthetic protein CobC